MLVTDVSCETKEEKTLLQQIKDLIDLHDPIVDTKNFDVLSKYVKEKTSLDFVDEKYQDILVCLETYYKELKK